MDLGVIRHVFDHKRRCCKGDVKSRCRPTPSQKRETGVYQLAVLFPPSLFFAVSLGVKTTSGDPTSKVLGNGIPCPHPLDRSESLQAFSPHPLLFAFSSFRIDSLVFGFVSLTSSIFPASSFLFLHHRLSSSSLSFLFSILRLFFQPVLRSFLLLPSVVHKSLFFLYTFLLSSFLSTVMRYKNQCSPKKIRNILNGRRNLTTPSRSMSLREPYRALSDGATTLNFIAEGTDVVAVLRHACTNPLRCWLE